MYATHPGGFGDARLQCIGGALLAAMPRKRTMCVHALTNGRSQARQFQRFLDNEAVSRREMPVHAGRLTGQRAKGRHVLAISDTSEMNFAAHTGRKRGFGTVGNGTDIGVPLKGRGETRPCNLDRNMQCRWHRPNHGTSSLRFSQ